MKKLFFASFFCIFALTGCSDNKKDATEKKPSDIAKLYFANIIKGKTDAASGLVYIPNAVKDKNAFKNSVKDLLDNKYSELNKQGDMENISVREVYPVQVTLKFKNNPTETVKNINLVKFGDTYRILLLDNK
jgi:hypothetical protein